MILERLCRILYEFDNIAVYNLTCKTLEETFDSYKKADEETREKILAVVSPSTKEKIIAMSEGGML